MKIDAKVAQWLLELDSDERCKIILIDYVTERKNTKRTIMKLTGQEFRVVVPEFYLDKIKEIFDFLYNNDTWIVEQLEKLVNKSQMSWVAKYEHGGRLSVLGKCHRLEVHYDGWHPLECHDGVIAMHMPSSYLSESKRNVEQVLRANAQGLLERHMQQMLQERGEPLFARMNMSPSRVDWSSAISFWGQCSHAGVIELSWRLACLDPIFFDFCLSHELAHLKVMGHTKEFYDFLKQCCPEYESIDRQLNIYDIVSLA